MTRLPRLFGLGIAFGLSALMSSTLWAQERIEPLGSWTLGGVSFSAPMSWEAPSVDSTTPPTLDLTGDDWTYTITDKPDRPDLGATLVLWWSNDIDTSGNHPVVQTRRPGDLGGRTALRIDWADPEMGWRGIDLVVATPPLAGKPFSLSCRAPAQRWSAIAPICDEIARSVRFESPATDTSPPVADTPAVSQPATPTPTDATTATPTPASDPAGASASAPLPTSPLATPATPPTTQPTPKPAPTPSTAVVVPPTATSPAPSAPAPAWPWSLVATAMAALAALGVGLGVALGVARRRRVAAPTPPPPPPTAPEPPPRPARFCTECGAPIISGSTCPRCGATDPPS